MFLKIIVSVRSVAHAKDFNGRVGQSALYMEIIQNFFIVQKMIAIVNDGGFKQRV